MKNKLSLILIITASLLSGCSTTPVTSVITDPTTVQDVARTATILFVQQNPSARADIAAADAAITVLLNNGTLDPAMVKTALLAAGVNGQNTALYASMVTTIVDQYSKYAGQNTVAGALNKNAQLSAALSAILAGTTQGLNMTQ